MLTGDVRYRCTGTGEPVSQVLGRVTVRPHPSQSLLINRGSSGQGVNPGGAMGDVQ
ncbi:MAG TPA: hypothetical protein VHZ96_23080 [Frankiaceae bacterium]|jgi:hypothetical protein|nr:hypothetical protein [Frankiaceae bacterium]